MLKPFKKLTIQELKAHDQISIQIENAENKLAKGDLINAKLKLIIAVGRIGTEYKKIEKRIRCKSPIKIAKNT